MTNAFVGLMLATGVGAWVYYYMHNKTGGNTQTAMIMAGIAGFFAFIVMMVILSMLPKN